MFSVDLEVLEKGYWFERLEKNREGFRNLINSLIANEYPVSAIGRSKTPPPTTVDEETNMIPAWDPMSIGAATVYNHGE